MEKVEHAVVCALEDHPQLVNPIAKEVGLGPSKLVPELAQPLNPHDALVLDFRG